MVTIRQLAACLGVFGPVVSVRPLFAAKSPPLSVLALISKAMQRKVDLNIIRVGAESFTAQDEFEIFAALKVLEVLYSTVDLGIGKTEHFGIPLDEANGHEDIDSLDEATALEDEFGFSGKAVDIFLVQTFAGPVVGRSPIGGACKGADEPD